MTDPRQFYTERVPQQFNAALKDQEALGDVGRRVLDDMKAVNATIRVEVAGESFFLNIAQGHMTSGNTPDHPPFMTLVQDRAAFERLAAEAGDSAMALLGGLSGLAGEMKLTRTRIDNLGMARGSIRFEVEGDNGFSLITHFGEDPIPDEPDASITVAADVYQKLRAGNVDPPQAFLDGKIKIDGDMQLTMQLALAAVAPD